MNELINEVTIVEYIKLEAKLNYKPCIKSQKLVLDSFQSSLQELPKKLLSCCH